jgi:hypothetical protein
MTSLRDRLGLPEPAPDAVLLGRPAQAPKAALLSELAEEAQGAGDDVVDACVAEALSDWAPLMAPVAGALERLERAQTFDEARAVLAELGAEGLQLGALVESLAGELLRLRGVGDATDKVQL